MRPPRLKAKSRSFAPRFWHAKRDLMALFEEAYRLVSEASLLLVLGEPEDNPVTPEAKAINFQPVRRK